MSKKPKKKLARLKPEENKAWVFAFEYYKNDGKTDLQADKLSWRDVCEEFPRLKKYDGALP
jgi:hypothetical protein